jgi:hypothetical protein
MRIAAYVRPWSKDYYEYFLAKAFPGQQYFFLSDWRGLGDYDWSDAFYRRYKGAPDEALTPHWLSIAVEYEIILRNPMLRSMCLIDASHYVRSMSASIEEMLDQVQPDIVFSPAVDSYVMDLLMRHCLARSIPYCGMLPSPVTGYTRITAIGEQLNFREPTNAEVEEAVRRIDDPTFTPVDLAEWLKMYGNSNVCLKRALREIPKPYFFPLLGRLRGDPQNYHYKASALSRISLFSQALFIDRFFDERWLDRIRSWQGTKVYIPLQAFPECTTDYHVAQLDLIDFPRMLPRLIDAICADGNNLVCVKEHPGMMGVRPPGFYDSIMRRKNVVLLSGDIPASSLIAETDILVTWTGTGGLEAAIRGKPVITIGKPYYNIGGCFSTILNLSDLDNAASNVLQLCGRCVTKEEKYSIAKHVLSGTIPGEYRFIRFDNRDETLVRDANNLAEGVRRHFSEWVEASAKFHGKSFASSLIGES